MTGRPRQRAAGRDRRHLSPGRPRQVKIRYTDTEYTDLATAAVAAGLTPTGYAAEAALAAARHANPPSTAPWRQALLELMAARGQVRRFGSNVNQAARALNALGEAPEWLAQSVAITTRAVTRVDEAAATVASIARHDPTTTGRRPLSASTRDTGHDMRPDNWPATGQPTDSATAETPASSARDMADTVGQEGVA